MPAVFWLIGNFTPSTAPYLGFLNPQEGRLDASAGRR
jgi:hypothetical protein